jgi:Protein of unknown function (DUF2493).
VKVLVCGGRDFSDIFAMRAALKELLPGTIIVHGAAKGADALAGTVAREMGFEVREYPAKWDVHGRSAGPRRNIEMLEKEIPDLVIAFPGGKGTAHMCSIAEKAGVTVKKL